MMSFIALLRFLLVLVAGGLSFSLRRVWGRLALRAAFHPVSMFLAPDPAGVRGPARVHPSVSNASPGRSRCCRASEAAPSGSPRSRLARIATRRTPPA